MKVELQALPLIIFVPLSKSLISSPSLRAPSCTMGIIIPTTGVADSNHSGHVRRRVEGTARA